MPSSCMVMLNCASIISFISFQCLHGSSSVLNSMDLYLNSLVL